jgi:18S rRNA (adenine1779-N6/adenine1780-N6)-dimethyltransferase
MIDSDFDIKQKILGILESVNMSDMRAARCDLDDFLK